MHFFKAFSLFLHGLEPCLGVTLIQFLFSFLFLSSVVNFSFQEDPALKELYLPASIFFAILLQT